MYAHLEEIIRRACASQLEAFGRDVQASENLLCQNQVKDFKGQHGAGSKKLWRDDFSVWLKHVTRGVIQWEAIRRYRVEVELTFKERFCQESTLRKIKSDEESIVFESGCWSE
mmetsp:Transcript_8430/g.8593  ORF Transcript_8430/g.8593 Transcript_8430/m.8593 type:complete len:113 (-) Transcript_8430:1239-1577(-)